LFSRLRALRSILKGKRDCHGLATLPDMQGRSMRRQTLLCLKSLGACSALWAAGCGSHPPPPALSGPDTVPAPRTIDLPPNIRPLLQADSHENDDFVGGSIPAQYEQPQAPTNSRPRITAVSGSTSSASPSAGSVRDSYWGNPRATTASSSVMPRGDFLPFVPPRLNASQQSAPLPSTNPPVANLPFANQPSAQVIPPAAASSVQLPAAPTSFPAAKNPELGALSGGMSYPSAPPVATPQPTAVQPPSNSNTSLYSAPPPQQQSAYVPAAQQAAVPPQPSLAQPQQPSPQIQPSAAMNAVAQQAIQMADQAATMARRGMLYSANSELVKGLTLISQSLDVEQGTMAHATALTAGLTALDEAHDFADARNQKGAATDVAVISRNHQTKLSAPLDRGTSPVVAQQQYFGFAQQQLELAGGGLRASSEILFRLGRLQTAMATHDNDPEALHAPQAIVFHQAALATDANNWLAANELGVLYARYGQLSQARQLLVQSVMIHPHRQGWQNLAVIHRRLGEIDLAQRAAAEIQLLDKQQGQTIESNDVVRWVDPKAFAATSSGDANWPATVATKQVASGSGSTRR
jgi:hypothetical protein